MVGKIVGKVVLLAAAVTVPAVCFTGYDFWKKSSGKTDGSSSRATVPTDPSSGNAATAASGRGGTLEIEGPPVRDLAEIFRFDVTADWILRRWPRVSTGLGQIQLQGYRVVLVTGTAETDLAGSLTYYFDAQQRLQRIAFQGITGDPRGLVALLNARFGYVRRPTSDPGLAAYEARRADGSAAGSVEIRSAGIIRASEPHQRYDVTLTIERPEQ